MYPCGRAHGALVWSDYLRWVAGWQRGIDKVAYQFTCVSDIISTVFGGDTSHIIAHNMHGGTVRLMVFHEGNEAGGMEHVLPTGPSETEILNQTAGNSFMRIDGLMDRDEQFGFRLVCGGTHAFTHIQTHAHTRTDRCTY